MLSVAIEKYIEKNKNKKNEKDKTNKLPRVYKPLPKDNANIVSFSFPVKK